MTYKITPILQNQFRVVVTGIGTAYFTQMSGLGGERESTPVYDGLNPNPRYASGNLEYTPLELVKPYDPSVDYVWFDALADSDKEYSISITPVIGDNEYQTISVIGKLTALSGPEVDAAGSDVAEITLTFSYSDL